MTDMPTNSSDFDDRRCSSSNDRLWTWAEATHAAGPSDGLGRPRIDWEQLSGTYLRFPPSGEDTVSSTRQTA